MEIVKTDYWRKPIPTDKFDWSAWVDGQEEWGSGFGPTEQDAVADLLWHLENKCRCGNNGGGDCDYCQTRHSIELELKS
jgi:hypothetical protein